MRCERCHVDAVRPEQQTGHLSCEWCGWCLGGENCNGTWTSTTDQTVTIEPTWEVRRGA